MPSFNRYDFASGDVVVTHRSQENQQTCLGSSFGFGWRGIIIAIEENCARIELLEDYVLNIGRETVSYRRGTTQWIKYANLLFASNKPRKKSKKNGFSSFISKLS